MSCWIRNNQYKIKNRYPIQFDEIEKFQFVELRKSEVVRNRKFEFSLEVFLGI